MTVVRAQHEIMWIYRLRMGLKCTRDLAWCCVGWDFVFGGGMWPPVTGETPVLLDDGESAKPQAALVWLYILSLSRGADSALPVARNLRRDGTIPHSAAKRV